TCIALIVGAICSTLVMDALKKSVPPITAPFVIVTWIVMLLVLYVFNTKFLLPSSLPLDTIDIFSASANGFGQVMFQENIITGIFFFFAILINSRISALYAFYASMLGYLIGWILSEPISALNAGLMGYNGIL